VKIRAIQWAAVDTYLKLVRLPFDTAIRMFPDGGTGVRPAAKAAVDGADAGIRAIVAMALGYPVSVGDATGLRRHGDREERHDGRGHESSEQRARHLKEQRERAKEQRARPRDKAAPAGQQAAAEERPRAVGETPAARPAPQAAPGSRARAAAMSATVGRTAARTAGSGSRPRVLDSVTPKHQPPPASADEVSPEPSHEEIAARAYELYERGVPGDADSHWAAAKRELTSASR
jgi:hypothetical protein